MSALSKALTDAKARMDESIDTIQQRAKKAGHPISRAAIGKYLTDAGAKQPPEQTIRGLAAGFKMPEQKIRQLLAMPTGERDPWVPPEESARLDRQQRVALDLLIKAIVKPAAGNGHNPPGSDARHKSDVFEDTTEGDRAPNHDHATDGDDLGDLAAVADAEGVYDVDLGSQSTDDGEPAETSRPAAHAGGDIPRLPAADHRA